MERGILGLLEEGPISAGGKLECEIVDRLKLDRKPTVYKQVFSKLERLEGKGTAIIERNGSVLRSVRLAPEVKAILPNFHTEDEEPEIEDSQPESENEVNPEPEEIQKESEEPAVAETPTNDNDPQWVRLSLALLALQEAALPTNGRLQGSSAQIIAQVLGVSMSQANSLNGKLAKLGLRQTSGSKANTVHQINMTKKEITEDDLKPAAATTTEQEVEVAPVQDAATQPAEVVVDEEIASLEVAPVPAEKPQTVVQQMTALIKILDKKVRDLESDKRTLEKRIENQRNELIQKDKDLAEKARELREKDERFDKEGKQAAKLVTDLSESLQAANTKLGAASTQIEELRQQVIGLTETPDELVSDLLTRYLQTDSDTPS